MAGGMTNKQIAALCERPRNCEESGIKPPRENGSDRSHHSRGLPAIEFGSSKPAAFDRLVELLRIRRSPGCRSTARPAVGGDEVLAPRLLGLPRELLNTALASGSAAVRFGAGAVVIRPSRHAKSVPAADSRATHSIRRPCHATAGRARDIDRPPPSRRDRAAKSLRRVTANRPRRTCCLAYSAQPSGVPLLPDVANVQPRAAPD